MSCIYFVFACLFISCNGRNGRLTWENAIPEDEVHIKVGGDAGGGSFKMAFLIANVQKPNSKTNTVVFAMFHAKDSWANLKTALLQYKQQVNILRESSWRLVTKSRMRHVQKATCQKFFKKCLHLTGAESKWCLSLGIMSFYASFLELLELQVSSNK